MQSPVVHVPLRSAFVLGCALGCVLGAAPAGAAELEPGSRDGVCTEAIHGHVVDADTHAPVVGATVRLGDEDFAVTGRGGRLDVENLCPGEIAIEVTAPGYRGVQQSVDVPTGDSFELELERDVETMVIRAESPRMLGLGSGAILSPEILEERRGLSFSETLAEIPGVSQLRAGSGMAKPIVRGQFGNRLLLIVDGVRHRAQQWGLDHAPEIDPFMAGALQVVRGPSGVRHGSDAIGGVIIVEPPPVSVDPGVAAELHLHGTHDGPGAGVAARVNAASSSIPDTGLVLEGSLELLGAPSTPDYPLDNTAHQEWNVGATVFHDRGPAAYQLSLRLHDAKLGVCSCYSIESPEDFAANLERERPVGADLFEAGLEIDRPYQAVRHGLLVARGQWRVGSFRSVSATYALQRDDRREFAMVRQGQTGPQFDFRLTTHDADVTARHDTLHLGEHLHLDGALGAAAVVQHQDYSGRPLVPDHDAAGGGVFVTQRLSGDEFDVEAGLRYDLLSRTASIERIDFLRLVRSDQLAEDACGDLPARDRAVSCDSRFHTLAASLGARRWLSSALSVQVEVATASRAPTPDEQYLNGTAPSFPVFGLGKPDLGVERTYAVSGTSTYLGQRVSGEVSLYGNYIDDYIYLAPAVGPDGNPIFDVLIRGTFPRFVTRAVDATFYGLDGSVSFSPTGWLDLDAQAAMVRGRNVTDETYLVFVPPDRFRATATATLLDALGASELSAGVGATLVRHQDRFEPAADLAPPPDGHFLLDARLGAQWLVGDERLKATLEGTNLLNTRYREYTSLLRYFVDQPGFQLMARLSVFFGS